MLIGVTGNIGSGKTKVAERLACLFDSEALNADLICRELMEPGEEGFLEFLVQGGKRFLGSDGTLDRGKLREAVFREPAVKAILESILHPLVRKRVLKAGRDCGEGAVVVAEIPLLFESGLENDFDAVVSVFADEKVMIERVSARDGVEPEDVRRILVSQLGQEEKRHRSDHVIDNSGEWSDTERQILDLATKLGRKNTEDKSSGGV